MSGTTMPPLRFQALGHAEGGSGWCSRTQSEVLTLASPLAKGPEHCSDLFDIGVGNLERGKMTASSMLGPMHDVGLAVFHPLPYGRSNLLREHCKPSGNIHGMAGAFAEALPVQPAGGGCIAVDPIKHDVIE